MCIHAQALSAIRRSVRWAPLLAIVATVMLLASMSPVRAKARAPIADRKTERLAFAWMCAEEPRWRLEARHQFPADAWSQDDAFRQHEWNRALSFATANGVRVADVLRVFDDGLHAAWATPAGIARPRGTIVPLHPRPID